MRKRPSRPKAMSAVGLPVHEQGHPIGRRVVADHFDQGGGKGVRDGRRGAEHGRLPPARAVTGGHHGEDDERAGAAPDHDPAQIGGHLLPPARVGEEEESREPYGDGAGADPLADGDGEAEVGPEDEDEEQQFHGQDRLHHREPPVVQREGLQQEGADHEAETQQPHPSADGMRHQAEAHGGLLRGVFDAHALEHAGQRVRQGRCYGKDIDHRLAVNLMADVIDHAGGSQLALRFRLARGAAASRRNRVQTGTAHRIGPLPVGFLH